MSVSNGLRALRAASLIAALALNSAAFAEVYQCTQNGKTVYTDTPCDANATPQTIAEPNTAPAPAKFSELAHEYDTQAAIDAAQKKKADAAWLKDYASTKAQADAIRKGEAEGRVVKGMTQDQVERILNEPQRVENPGGSKVRWLYVNGRDRRTVVFKEGLVVGDATHYSERH